MIDTRKVYNRLKRRAKEKGLEFDLTHSFLNEITCPITCPLLGSRINYNSRKAVDESPSFDRIDSSKGYTQDNIWIISLKANRMKNNGTFDEISKFSTNGLQALSEQIVVDPKGE